MNPVAEHTETEDLEEKGFKAAVDSLVPEAEKTPFSLGEKTEEVDATLPPSEVGGEGEGEGEGEISEAKAEEKADEIVEQAEKFLGDKTADEVLEILSKVEGLEDKVFEKVSAKVFGKFGEVGQQLKALQERTLSVDATKLTKLKELDEGIYDALVEGLPQAISGQQFDSESATKNIRNSIMADLAPMVERRLLYSLVPDVEEISQSKEFEEYFFKDASQETREMFQAWDEGTRMDGVLMAKAFREFQEFQTKKTEGKKAKQEAIAKSVESGKKGAAPPARRHMSEEEAFATRTKEIAKS